MAKPGKLPAYAAEMEARNKAHAAELAEIVSDLPLQMGQRALDLGSGDGTFLRLLEPHVGPSGVVVGLDASRSYLHLAEQRASAPTLLIGADFHRLPFDDDTFDLAWCAHGLVSLQPPETAIREMCRVVRPGSWVAALENDLLHEALLPWPEELELAIREAEIAAQRARGRGKSSRYVARRLRGWFMAAGLESVTTRSYAIDRCAPLAAADMVYLDLYLRRIRDQVAKFLSPDHRRQLETLVDPQSAEYLPSQPDLAMTWLEVVCRGQKSR